jgi:hypothetical protein
MFFGPYGYDGRSLFKSESLRTELAGAWQFLAPQILREWIRRKPRAGDHGGAGTRPAAWWCFDARERRRRVDGKPHPFDNPERRAKIAGIVAQYPHRAPDLDYLYYGGLGAFVVPDDHEAVFESEYEYLKRLNLLLPGEAELYAERLRREALREERKNELRLEDMEL